jgi:hypothetical protein
MLIGTLGFYRIRGKLASGGAWQRFSLFIEVSEAF